MKNILIGIMDSNVGGLNRFVLDYISQNKEDYFVILSKATLNEIYSNEMPLNCVLEIIPSVTHPKRLYSSTKTIISKYNIDTLYINVSTNLFYPILKAAYDSGVKERIVHSHSSYSADTSFFKRNIIVCLNKLLQRKANKLVTVRKACSDKAAVWLFGKKTKYEFVYNRVSGNKFNFDIEKRNRLRFELGIEKFLIIGFVGGFNYQKNITYFFDIARVLKKIRSDFRIVMLGEGELKERFEQSVLKHHLQQYFVLLGNKPNANDYYNIFDCFVMPSRFEGLPIVGLEAQVNGLKCFFSSGITNQVLITEEAEIFNLKKVNNLAKKITSVEIGNHTVTKKKEYNNFVI